MAQIPYSKLSNLRSGMTVWRVFGFMDDNGNIDSLSASEYHVTGKRVLHHHSSNFKGSGTMKMVWRRFESLKGQYRPSWMYNGRTHFLNDLHGYGCFSTRRSALRFVAEVKAGLHPDILEAMKDHRDFTKELDAMSSAHSHDSDDDFVSEMDSPSHHNMMGD